jgi:hypothetical protein
VPRPTALRWCAQSWQWPDSTNPVHLSARLPVSDSAPGPHALADVMSLLPKTAEAQAGGLWAVPPSARISTARQTRGAVTPSTWSLKTRPPSRL